VTPFVYRRTVDPTIVAALADLVLRSRVELSNDPGRDLKLGPGGIREVEFFVQTLQLVWGGQDPSLRVRGTLPALARLRANGLVTEREGRAIADAFVLLRSAEHAIQWARGTQTHELPTDPVELERLARTLGYASSSAFTAALEEARATVAELFASLAPDRPPPPRSRSAEIMQLLAGDDDERLVAAVERRFGVDVTEHLQALARRPDGPLGEATAGALPGVRGAGARRPRGLGQPGPGRPFPARVLSSVLSPPAPTSRGSPPTSTRCAAWVRAFGATSSWGTRWWRALIWRTSCSGGARSRSRAASSATRSPWPGGAWPTKPTPRTRGRPSSLPPAAPSSG
jgi:hypothetical protein